MKLIKTAAKDNKIPFQNAAVSRATGTDTDAFAYSNGGVASALISLPLKYMHTTVESAHKDDIDLAVGAAKAKGAIDISLFQCTSIYPTPADEVNLSTIRWLKETYNCPVGLSDHAVGSDAVFLSIAAGATLIEKHFSLDPTRVGFDHHVSLDKEGLKLMVERVRLAEVLMGREEKTVSPKVQVTRDRYLRYIVAAKVICETDRFDNSNVCVKRTLPNAKGINPKEISKLFGKVSGRKYNIDDVIRFEVNF